MNQHEPSLEPIKAPEGYRPVFADMDGLTPTEYRVRQREREVPSAAFGTATRDEIMEAYRRLGSWTAVARVFDSTPYHIKRVVRGG